MFLFFFNARQLITLHDFPSSFSAEAFDSDAANSFFLRSLSYGEGSDAVALPARPRTTEDLFAAIHRYFLSSHVCIASYALSHGLIKSSQDIQ